MIRRSGTREISLLAIVVSSLALLVVFSSGAALAASASDGTQVIVPRGQPVEVAFAADLTGSANGFTASLANAVQMAVEAHPAIRGFPIQINLVDPPCGDATLDVAAARAIVADTQNVGVFGQFCSSGFDQALPAYQAGDLVTIMGSATDPSLPSFGPSVFNSVAVPDGCCPFVDQFDPWYAIIVTLPSDLDWRQAYSLQFGAPPTAFADLYYDAASLLIRNLQDISSLEGSGNLVISRAALAQAVRETTKYQGVTCAITLDAATGYRANDAIALSRCAD